MNGRRLLASLLVTSFALGPIASTVAHAEPTAADMETARDLYKKGKDLRDKGDLVGAIEKFKAAWALAGTPILGLELGKTLMAHGELVEARETLVAVGRIPPKPNESGPTKTARAEAAQLANDLKPRIPSLTVKVTGAPVEAIKLTIDGVAIPTAALGEPRKVNPGKHQVVASAGADEIRKEVELAEGDDRSVALEVTPPKPKPATVAPPPEAAAAPPPPPVAAPAPASSMTGTTWLGLGLLGVGVVAGGVTGGIAWSKASSVRKQCVDGGCPPATHDDLDTGKTMGTVSTISFIVAGVGGIMVATSLVLGASPTPTKTGSLQPLVGLGTLGLRGSF